MKIIFHHLENQIVKNQGEGYVKEEAKIIDELVSPSKKERKEIHKLAKNTVGNIIEKAQISATKKLVEPKENKMEFDAESDEPKGKRVPIQFNSTDIAKFYEFMNVGKGKKMTEERINGIKKLFDNDENIKIGMTKLQIEKYLAKVYKTNFAINNKK